MKKLFSISDFIRDHITHRPRSLFHSDMAKHESSFWEAVEGKTILVIGGAGTIGSSFIKACIRYTPRKLIIADLSENGLTELVRDCRSMSDIDMPGVFKTYPVNFSDDVFFKIFRNEGPFDIVANFAAHKHVRSEKDLYSIEAMLTNNVFRAKELLDFLIDTGTRRYFCVSTDKAANPANVMGASKKLMEEVLLAYSDKINVTTARFANVAFSNGSLLDGFVERLAKQQPLSCPADVKRFFVSPAESGEICLCACVLGESGDIFFPKLVGDSMVYFSDLVRPFLEEFGFEVLICKSEDEAKSRVTEIRNGKYPVYFFKSETSGEKLQEEFFTDNEDIDLQKFESLGIVKNSSTMAIEKLTAVIDGLKDFFKNENASKEDLIRLLKTAVPSFNHIETGINLDNKM